MAIYIDLYSTEVMTLAWPWRHLKVGNHTRVLCRWMGSCFDACVNIDPLVQYVYDMSTMWHDDISKHHTFLLRSRNAVSQVLSVIVIITKC